MNLDVQLHRSQIIRAIRAWFDARDFVEMHTQRLVGLPGQEPYLEPFWTTVTEQNGASHPAALITSPEYQMKRLLAEGAERIYDLGPCFRNEEPWDGTHDPEFLLLEWYRRDAGITELMNDAEQMMKDVARRIDPQSTIIPDVPFRRITVEEAWRTHAGVELTPLLNDRAAMQAVAQNLGQTVTDADSWDDIYFKVFLSIIEPKIIADQTPTFLYRYPASMAALSRLSEDSRYAERVELYAGGVELANGFAELSDAAVQRERFMEEQSCRSRMGKKTWALDETFLSSLPKMGNAAGIAFGVDRFVMLLLGKTSMNDVVPVTAKERFGNP